MDTFVTVPDCIVLDSDFTSTRVGFASSPIEVNELGELTVKQMEVSETLVCLPRNSAHMMPERGLYGKYLRVGITPRGLCKIVHPLERGHVSDWHAMSAIYQHAITYFRYDVCICFLYYFVCCFYFLFCLIDFFLFILYLFISTLCFLLL
jgi:hypothetical protein